MNLNWSVASEADLDLKCMVRTPGGSGVALLPLGAEFGDLEQRSAGDRDRVDGLLRRSPSRRYAVSRVASHRPSGIEANASTNPVAAIPVWIYRLARIAR